MTPTIAKVFFVCCVVGWWLIRFPHERKVRKNAIKTGKRDGMELLLLGISLTGLGIIPVAYVFTGFPAFAERATGTHARDFRLEAAGNGRFVAAQAFCPSSRKAAPADVTLCNVWITVINWVWRGAPGQGRDVGEGTGRERITIQ